MFKKNIYLIYRLSVQYSMLFYFMLIAFSLLDEVLLKSAVQRFHSAPLMPYGVWAAFLQRHACLSAAVVQLRFADVENHVPGNEEQWSSSTRSPSS